MSKSILVDKDILYSRLEKMIELAENDSTSKQTIARMKEQRNNIHHAIQDTTELLKALERLSKIAKKGYHPVREEDTVEFIANKLRKALGGNKND